MTLTQDTIARIDETGGKSIRTYKDGVSNTHHQAVGLCDDKGKQSGVETNPIWAYIKTLGVIDSVRSEGAVSVIQALFSRWWPKGVTYELADQNGSFKPSATFDSSGGLLLSGGNQQHAKAAVRSLFGVPNIMGMGSIYGFSIRLTNISTAVGHQIKRWGVGDTTDGVFVEWIGTDNKLYLKVYHGGTAIVNVASENWTLPTTYDSGNGRLKESIQHWVFKIDWIHGHIQVLLDEVLVMNHQLSGSALKTMGRDTAGRLNVELQATAGAPVNANNLYIYGIYALSLSPEKWSGMASRVAGIGAVPFLANGTGNVLHLLFRPNRTANSVAVNNNRIARVSRITISHYATVGGLESLDAGHIRVIKGHYRSGGTKCDDDSPRDIATVWNGLTATQGGVQAAIGTVAATLSGYADDDLVRYKITALGAQGETTPGTFLTSQIDVQSPAQVVDVTIQSPVPNVVAYNIYRQIGTGTYQYIATVDAVVMARNGFKDIGYRADSTKTPPTSNDAEGESYMEAYAGVDNTNWAGGQVIESLAVAAGTHTIDYKDGELVLYPGETLSIFLDYNKKASVYCSSVHWIEEAT